MSKKDVNIKIDELSSALGTFKGLQINIGRLIDEEWDEPMGPTPFPSVGTLRDWDHKLLEKYKPFYMPFCDLCCLCTFGKCDLTGDKKGACGLTMAGQQSRIVLLACCIGASTHCAHARHMLTHLLEEYGREHPIEVALNTNVNAPHIRLVCGFRPKTIGDLEEALDYVETQLVQLTAAAHTGQEGNPLDFESKAFHAGMLDHVAMEVADIAQITTLGMPKGVSESPLTTLGFGSLDTSKAMIMCIGHNVLPSVDIIDYLMEHDLFDQVEIGGLCCTAHDNSRYDNRAKIMGPISWQIRYVRSGIPDVIVIDEQCIRTDILDEAEKIGAPVIATSEKSMMGLPDRTYDNPDSIVADLVSGRHKGVLILEPDKVGEVVVKTVLAISPQRGQYKNPSIKELLEGIEECRGCSECVSACPNSLPIMDAIKTAETGDLSQLKELQLLCVGCGRCESACPENLPILSYMYAASAESCADECFNVRVGSGAITDVEIREVGRGIVFGEIPGVVALVGCANYPKGGGEVATIAEEFLKRRFIVLASGCSAMDLATVMDDDGQNLYDKYPAAFDAGGLVNVGSCVSNSHITGATVKIANIFAKRPLRGNYEEIADYIYNRVGAVGVAWGAMSQKAASIAAGCWRLGIPVIVGPHGSKYRRNLLGRKENEEDWITFDARTGEEMYVGPVPEHLFYAAETIEEAIVLTAKLSMRPNDTTKGRAVKISHYIDLHKKYYGTMPDDLELFVRREADLPFTMKAELLTHLESKGWIEDKIGLPDPTLLERMLRGKK